MTPSTPVHSSSTKPLCLLLLFLQLHLFFIKSIFFLLAGERESWGEREREREREKREISRKYILQEGVVAEMIRAGIIIISVLIRDRHILLLKLYTNFLFLPSNRIFQYSFLFNLLFSHINKIILILMVININ